MEEVERAKTTCTYRCYIVLLLFFKFYHSRGGYEAASRNFNEKDLDVDVSK